MIIFRRNPAYCIRPLFVAVLFAAFLVASCGGGEQAVVYPGADWERISAGEAGFSQDGLDAVVQYAESLATTGLVVTVHGKILLDYGDITELSYIASVRKSVLAMIYGNYVADGTVDLNETLADLEIIDHGGLSDQEKEATVADLLGARSGVYHPASNGGDNLADAPERGSQKHGEYFLYSNWDFNTLGFIFEQETGKNIYDAVESDIALPVGMQDWDRSAQRKSGNLDISLYPAYHMYFSTRDMARIGYLMLRGGVWEGKQLIPADWTNRISGIVTPLEEMNPERTREGMLGYGYLWWIFDGPDVTGSFEGAYTGIGHGGQYITVIPKLDMVVAHKVNLRKSNNLAVSRDEFFTLLEKLFASKN